MPTSITSSGITFDDATTQTTSATKAGGIGSTQLAAGAVTPEKLSQKLTFDTAKTAASFGGSVEFTGIPSWAKKITVLLDDVSTNGAQYLTLQVGISTGFVTSNYNNSSAFTGLGYNGGSTGDGVALDLSGSTNNANFQRYGQIVLTNITGNTWVIAHTIGIVSGSGRYVSVGGASIALTASLDRVRVWARGDTFDAGTINISYEG